MNAREQALQWASGNAFDEETRKNAAEILRNEEQILSAFGNELQFGTGGLRGILGTGTNRMNRYTVARATLGLACSLGSRGSVVIAYDSRIGSEEFAEVAAGVLASEGIRAFVFEELAPTPMLSFAVRKLHADAGVMITASHNPAEYNGYKVYGADGCQITDRAAAAVTKEIQKVSYPEAKWLSKEEARKAALWVDVPEEIRRSFTQHCLNVRVAPQASASIHAVYTPLHGTGLKPVQEVLRSMKGISVTLVESQCMPDGHFPTCPKPNPELDETLALGLEKAKETQADLLLATDPDCDRVGVALRKPDGSYERITGNETGLLLLDHILSARKKTGTLPKHAVVVKTIVSSELAKAIAEDYGVQVTEVLTGFKYIGEIIGMLEKQGMESDFVFGFEESCGYLAGTHVHDKDGVMACMLVCEMAQNCKEAGLTPWERLQRLYARYGNLENRLLSFEISGAMPMETMKQTMEELRSNPPKALAGGPLTEQKDYLQGINGLPKSNVLVFATAKAQAIVRPSGTEPKVKVYLSAKGQNKAETKDLLDRLEEEISLLLKR